MVDIEYLRERPRLKTKSITDKGPLEVTHSALTTFNATIQGGDTPRSKTIDTPTDLAGIVTAVEEACNTQ